MSAFMICENQGERTTDSSSGGARPFEDACPTKILFATGSFRP